MSLSSLAGEASKSSAGHDHPLVSCLMVTLPVPARLAHVRASLADYGCQTHGPRELVMVLNGGTADARAAIRDMARDIARPDIRVVEPTEVLTLGALRNISLREARGAVLCQWDDDDRYHPERIARQLAALRDTGAIAVGLSEVMQFVVAERHLYLINWALTPATMKPGSVMFLRSAPIRYPETGAEARLGEDLVVLSQLQAAGACYGLAGEPYLYLYTTHGDNMQPEAHHRMLAERLAVSRGILLRREASLRAGLSAFDFGPEPVVVHGANGPAFTIAPA